MPYRAGYHSRHRHRRRARRHASGVIGRAWRKRQRRRAGGLVARTALANRRQIKRIKRGIETKMIELGNGVIANDYSAPSFVRQQVDINGFEGTGALPLVLKPMRSLVRGDGPNEMAGEWVKMKSLTYKIYFQATAGLLGETNNVGCLIVLDRDPTSAVSPSLTGLTPGTLDTGALLGGNSQLPMLRYQNLDTCGKTNRYKVLRHIRARVQSTATSVLPPDKVVSGTLKLPYNVQYGTPVAPVVPQTPFRPINQELLFFFYSDSAAAPHPTCSIHCRFRFKDA